MSLRPRHFPSTTKRFLAILACIGFLKSCPFISLVGNDKLCHYLINEIFITLMHIGNCVPEKYLKSHEKIPEVVVVIYFSAPVLTWTNSTKQL